MPGTGGRREIIMHMSDCATNNGPALTEGPCSCVVGELTEVWDQVCDFWDAQPNPIQLPWVEAKFKLSVFKVTLAQKHLKIPISLGSI